MAVEEPTRSAPVEAAGAYSPPGTRRSAPAAAERTWQRGAEDAQSRGQTSSLQQCCLHGRPSQARGQQLALQPLLTNGYHPTRCWSRCLDQSPPAGQRTHQNRAKPPLVQLSFLPSADVPRRVERTFSHLIQCEHDRVQSQLPRYLRRTVLARKSDSGLTSAACGANMLPFRLHAMIQHHLCGFEDRRPLELPLRLPMMRWHSATRWRGLAARPRGAGSVGQAYLQSQLHERPTLMPSDSTACHSSLAPPFPQ